MLADNNHSIKLEKRARKSYERGGRSSTASYWAIAILRYDHRKISI